MSQNSHIWSFSTIGGVKRVNIETGADLVNLEYLDPKLWTALSCPVTGLEIDHKTLGLIDKDNDGQIRVPEIIGAVKWITSVLKNPDDLIKQEKSLQLSAINNQTELGKTLLASAKVILKNLGKGDENKISAEDTSDTKKIFAATRFNGDGVITPDTCENEELKSLVNEIKSCVGEAHDRGGESGINETLLDEFFTECEKFSVWYSKKEAKTAVIFPFGDNTEKAFGLYKEVKSKIDDYFLRCRLAAFDVQTTSALNLQIARVESITAKDLSACLDEIASYPLAKIEAGLPLPLSTGLNPAWESKISLLNQLALSGIVKGKNNLNENDWQEVVHVFAGYSEWISNKEGSKVEKLGLEKVRAILSSESKQKLIELIARDKAVEAEANNVFLVDQMVRYHRDIFTLLKNFVTFYDFYMPGQKAIFQAGTLYIDQRSCDLCIKVSDMAKHANMVSFSGMFLLYCDCVSRSTNEKMTIVAALTNGDIDNLVVGRNALFYDRNGLDWDATVVKIVDNPISIRQAFFSPYRKVSRFIESQINKFASSQDEKVTGDMMKGVETVPSKVEEAKKEKPAPQPFDIGKFVGIFAAIGLAIGAIGSAIGSAIAGFIGLKWWQMPIAVAGIILLISGPSMIIAYLKLRKRNLAPILDANGWAINAQATVNIHFGNMLTRLAELPAGAKINLNDPFTKKKRPVLPAILIISVLIGCVLYLLWKYGYMHLPF